MRKFLITAGNKNIQTYWMHLESTGPLAALDHLYTTMDPIVAHGHQDTEIRVYEILSDWVWHRIQELDGMSFDPAILDMLVIGEIDLGDKAREGYTLEEVGQINKLNQGDDNA